MYVQIYGVYPGGNWKVELFFSIKGDVHIKVWTRVSNNLKFIYRQVVLLEFTQVHIEGAYVVSCVGYKHCFVQEFEAFGYFNFVLLDEDLASVIHYTCAEQLGPDSALGFGFWIFVKYIY